MCMCCGLKMCVLVENQSHCRSPYTPVEWLGRCCILLVYFYVVVVSFYDHAGRKNEKIAVFTYNMNSRNEWKGLGWLFSSWASNESASQDQETCRVASSVTPMRHFRHRFRWLSKVRQYWKSLRESRTVLYRTFTCPRAKCFWIYRRSYSDSPTVLFQICHSRKSEETNLANSSHCKRPFRWLARPFCKFSSKFSSESQDTYEFKSSHYPPLLNMSSH